MQRAHIAHDYWRQAVLTELSALLPPDASIDTSRANVCRKVVALVSRISGPELSKRRQEVTKISLRQLLALGLALAFPVTAYATDRHRLTVTRHVVEHAALRANVDPPVSAGPFFSFLWESSPIRRARGTPTGSAATSVIATRAASGAMWTDLDRDHE